MHSFSLHYSFPFLLYFIIKMIYSIVVRIVVFASS